MILGVPTLCCYDRLDALLRSAEAGAVRPSGYIVVDNGGKAIEKHETAELVLPENTRVVMPRRNLGVAASWNLIMRIVGGPVAISNDDIELDVETFGNLARGVSEARLVTSLGFALFAITPECVEKVGWFDERFYPAYYEDVDYHYRVVRSGIRSIGVPPPRAHAGSSTIREMPSWQRSEIDAGYMKNEAYFRRKWGGPPGQEVYTEPFDGKPES